jgi:hypothetical protein
LGAVRSRPRWRKPEIKLGLVNNYLGVREDGLARSIEQSTGMVSVEVSKKYGFDFGRHYAKPIKLSQEPATLGGGNPATASIDQRQPATIIDQEGMDEAVRGRALAALSIDLAQTLK